MYFLVILSTILFVIFKFFIVSILSIFSTSSELNSVSNSMLSFILLIMIGEMIKPTTIYNKDIMQRIKNNSLLILYKKNIEQIAKVKSNNIVIISQFTKKRNG